MRNLAGLVSVTAIALAAFATPAGADPANGKGLVTETFTCQSGPPSLTITHGSGFSGWDISSGQHYVLASIIYQQNGQSVAAHNFGVKNGMGVGVICSADEGNGRSIIVISLPVPPPNS